MKNGILIVLGFLTLNTFSQSNLLSEKSGDKTRISDFIKISIKEQKISKFDIKSRVDIGERQNTYFQNTNRTHVRTTWYFKAIKNDNVFDVDSQANNYLNSYLMTIDDE